MQRHKVAEKQRTKCGVGKINWNRIVELFLKTTLNKKTST